MSYGSPVFAPAADVVKPVNDSAVFRAVGGFAAGADADPPTGYKLAVEGNLALWDSGRDAYAKLDVPDGGGLDVDSGADADVNLKRNGNTEMILGISNVKAVYDIVANSDGAPNLGGANKRFNAAYLGDGGLLIYDEASGDVGTIVVTDDGMKISADGVGFFGVTPVAQPAHIADADGTLADITTKFNQLLADMASLGLQAAS